MRKLVDYLKKGRIPYYFHHDCNVLWARKNRDGGVAGEAAETFGGHQGDDLGRGN